MQRVVLRVVVCALAACASPAPESVDAPVALPGTFGDGGERVLPERWWLDFEDEALAALVEEALDTNLDLRTFWDRLAQIEAVAVIEGAPRRVQADVFARGRAGVAGRKSDTSSDNELSFGLAASYELDVWGRLRARHAAALLDVKASEEELMAAAISLTALVATSWYQLVEQRAQLDLLEQQLESNEQVLELLTLRFRQGQLAAADVLRQRQLVESTRGDRIAVEERIRLLEYQLAVLLGRAPGTLELPGRTELVELPPLPATGVPAALVERRPDVREVFHDVLAADRRVAEAIADRYPRFTLSLSASTGGPRLSDIFDTWFANLVLAAVQPLLDGGLRRAEVDRTRAVVSERVHQYGAAILLALREVEDALVQERKRTEQIENLDRRLALAREVLVRLRDRYTQGNVNYIDVLQALISQQSLERSRLAAERERIEFRINLCRALAGGWTMERPALATVRGPDGATEHESRLER
jgi:NodT family efflux transporter outer membrane factor (OMF) lipoprotein